MSQCPECGRELDTLMAQRPGPPVLERILTSRWLLAACGVLIVLAVVCGEAVFHR